MTRARSKLIKLFSCLLIAVILITPGIALAVGEEPCEQWNLQGDIQSEKEMEGQLFKIVGIGSTAMAPGAGPFSSILVGTGAISLGLDQLSKPENAIWENWPMGRYSFHHIPSQKFPGPSAWVEGGLAGTADLIANMIFDLTKTLTRISLNVTVLAFHTDIVSGMVGWISEGVATIFATDGDLSQLFIKIGLIFLLVYCGFRFFRGQAMSALSATFVAALAVGSVFFFTANAHQIITGVSRGSDSLAGAFLGAVGEYTASGRNVNIDDPIDRGLVAAGQTAWQAIVAKPWAVAMFGTSDESRLILTQSEYDVLDKSVFPNKSLSKIKPGMRIDTLFLGSTGDGRDAVAEALGRPNAKLLHVFKGQEVDHGDHPGTMTGLAPGATITHIMTAFFTFLPAIGYALLTGTVSLSIIVCQALIAGLLLILPVPLFAMMIPETGWSISSQYFRITAGFFLVKLIYGLYLSLVLVVGTGFAGAVMDQSGGLAMIILTAVFAAAAIFRKKFLNLLLDAVKNRKASSGGEYDTRKMINTSKTLARKLGVTDMFSDWWFSRKNRSQQNDEKDDTNKPPGSESQNQNNGKSGKQKQKETSEPKEAKRNNDSKPDNYLNTCRAVPSTNDKK